MWKSDVNLDNDASGYFLGRVIFYAFPAGSDHFDPDHDLVGQVFHYCKVRNILALGGGGEKNTN